MVIPQYPEWAPISLEMRTELMPWFLRLESGISEFTFSNIFLFRHTYGYKLTRFHEGLYGISGSKLGKSFFSLPWGLPEDKILLELFAGHDYLKNLSHHQSEIYAHRLKALGFDISEDRDNWDYLYLSDEMANLEGKRFHKKRNQIHGFFQDHTYEAKKMEPSDTPLALEILETWMEQKEEKADYLPSKESLEFQKELGLDGKLYFVNGKAVAYNLGEPVQNGKTYVIHFEKADNNFRGIYQVIFQDFARELMDKYQWINREQDLGDPGLRQAKETYRPADFVKKYQVHQSPTKM